MRSKKIYLNILKNNEKEIFCNLFYEISFILIIKCSNDILKKKNYRLILFLNVDEKFLNIILVKSR